MGDLTAHFSRSEFADRRSGVSPAPPCRLLASLENLRGQIRRPLRVVSGYRTKETNELVGGAPFSQHLFGNAVDLEAGYATVDQALEAGFTGIGSRGDWAIHVDCRPGPLTRWSYDGQRMLAGGPDGNEECCESL